MLDLARSERFEDAAVWRDRLTSLLRAVVRTQRLRELTAVEGVVTLLDHLDAQGVPTCVASSGTHDRIRRTLGITGLLMAVVFLTSIFGQSALGYSALESGLAFLPLAATLVVGTHLAAHGSARPVVRLGSSCHRPDVVARVEQGGHQPAADEAGGTGDEDRGGSHGGDVPRERTPRRVTASPSGHRARLAMLVRRSSFMPAS